MPFYQAVNILRRQDRYIKGVQVWYSDQVCILQETGSVGCLIQHLVGSSLGLFCAPVNWHRQETIIHKCFKYGIATQCAPGSVKI
jgi:hypothetical protein